MNRQQDKRKDRYIPRFAGEVFRRAHNPDDGPDLRRLVSTVAWKQPPSTSVQVK